MNKEFPPNFQELRKRFENSVAHLRLKIFDARIGQVVNHIIVHNSKGEYEPHFEEITIMMLYWDKNVTDWSDYYKLDEDGATRGTI